MECIRRAKVQSGGELQRLNRQRVAGRHAMTDRVKIGRYELHFVFALIKHWLAQSFEPQVMAGKECPLRIAKHTHGGPNRRMVAAKRDNEYIGIKVGLNHPQTPADPH